MQAEHGNDPGRPRNALQTCSIVARHEAKPGRIMMQAGRLAVPPTYASLCPWRTTQLVAAQSQHQHRDCIRPSYSVVLLACTVTQVHADVETGSMNT